jgi:hypothetical protein
MVVLDNLIIEGVHGQSSVIDTFISIKNFIYVVIFLQHVYSPRWLVVRTLCRFSQFFRRLGI